MTKGARIPWTVSYLLLSSHWPTLDKRSTLRYWSSPDSSGLAFLKVSNLIRIKDRRTLFPVHLIEAQLSCLGPLKVFSEHDEFYDRHTQLKRVQLSHKLSEQHAVHTHTDSQALTCIFGSAECTQTTRSHQRTAATQELYH